MRQQLLDMIYNGQPFRTVLRVLGLTSSQVWGLTKTDEEWSTALETALMATRRNDLEARHQRRLRRGLCMQPVQGVSAHSDRHEPEMGCRTKLTGLVTYS